jgi:hypothetical protein
VTEGSGTVAAVIELAVCVPKINDPLPASKAKSQVGSPLLAAKLLAERRIIALFDPAVAQLANASAQTVLPSDNAKM